MKKWEEQNRLKIHQKKVQGARSSVSKNSSRGLAEMKSPEIKRNLGTGNYSNPSASPHHSNQSNSIRGSQSGISDYFEFEKIDLTQIPLYKLLKYYGLQQYAKGLISRDFGYDLSRLARLTNQEIEFLATDLKILPGHKVKFHSLIRQIQHICVEIEKEAAAILQEAYYDNLPKTAKPTYSISRTSSQLSMYSNKPKSQGSNPSLPTMNMMAKKPQSTISTAQSRKTAQPSTDSAKKQGRNENLTQVPKKKIEASSCAGSSAIGFDFFKDSESVDDEFAKALEHILDKYQKEVNDDSSAFKRPNSGFLNKYTEDKKYYDPSQDSDLVKRINYSEPDRKKKDTSDASGSIHSTDNEHQKTFGGDSERNKDYSRQNSNSTARTVTSNTDTKQAAPKNQTQEKISLPNKTQPTQSKPIREIKPVSRDDSLPMKKGNLDLQAPIEKPSTITKTEVSKPADKTEKPQQNTQVKRIDKIISLDDAGAGKSNVVKLVEKNINKDITPETLNQELLKIKDLYASFDGAKMTSTLVNLDIEEMCFCLSCAIRKHIQYFLDNIYSPEYQDFVRINIFAQRDDQNAKEVRLNFGGMRNETQNMPGLTLMNPDKRQILNEVTQNQLVDQVSKPTGYSPSKRRHDQKRKMLSQEESSETPSMHRKQEELKNEYEDYDEEDRPQQDVSNNNPMDYVDNDERDYNPKAHIRPAIRRAGSDPDRYDQQDEDEEGEEAGHYYEGGYNGEGEVEEDLYPEYENGYRQQSLAIISERTGEHSEGHHTKNSQGISKNEEGHKNDVMPEEPQNEDIEKFLRESLRDSVMLSLRGSDHPHMKQKGLDLAVQGEQVYGSNNYNPNNEEYENEDFDNRQETEDKADPLEFSFESRYTTLDELESSQIDMDNRARIIFERTFNDKRWNEQDYFKRINANIDSGIISDYCKSVIITSKMEKEVVIVALIYIERLITSKNLYLNPANWRNTVFTALIIASKIWDDESYENENFAKAFPSYTTREINTLERVFLDFIEYDIVVGSSEYAKYYFILRTFAEKNKKSFPLRALEVNTVITLQKNSKHAAQVLKAMYVNSLNKTL